MNMKDPLRIFENADDDFTEKLSDTPKLNDIEKERMFKMSMNIYSEMRKNNSMDINMTAGDGVEGVEKYSRPVWYKPLMTAACLVAVAGIAGTVAFLKNHGGNHGVVNTPDIVATQVTTTIVTDTVNAMADVTTETTSVTTDVPVTTDNKQKANEVARILAEKVAEEEKKIQSEIANAAAEAAKTTQTTVAQAIAENEQPAETTTAMSEEDRQLVERANEFFETACNAYMGFRHGNGRFDVGEPEYDENGEFTGKRLEGTYDENGEYLGYLIKDPDINTVDDALAKYYEIFSTRYPDNISDYFVEHNGRVYWRSGGRGSTISYEYSKVTEVQRKEGDEIFFTVENSYCEDFELMNTGHGTIKRETFSVIVQPDGSWKVGQFRMPY